MFESLDPSIFAKLQHAYGSAKDVPGHLRALASEDLDDAGDALHELGAAIYHQGSYYSATAPAIPFLIELADAEIAARAEVLLFLADMSGAPDDPELAFQPYLFSSSPGWPDYPEAVATIDAIVGGRATYLRALSCADPRARACAAMLLVNLLGTRREGPADPELSESLGAAIGQALARETDEHARITLSFACMRLGLPLTMSGSGSGSGSGSSLHADVVAALEANREPERALPALARLLRLERKLDRHQVPYFDGDLIRFAALTLVQSFAADPRAFDLAADALADRFARGERIQPLPGSYLVRIGEAPSVAAPTTSFEDYFADVPLRSIAGAMAALAFGDRSRDPTLLRRDQLDDRMRRVLALTIDHSIPVPVAGVPWIDASSMARFLAGDGPLDQPFTWNGATEPLYVTLGALTRGDEPNEHEAEVDQLFAELAKTWSARALVELAIDILANAYELAPYGPPQPPIQTAIAKYVTPRVIAEPALLDDYRESLSTSDNLTGAQAKFAFAAEIAAGIPVEPRFDAVARSAIANDVVRGRDWLICFPEPRRSQMVAAWGNGYLYGKFVGDCDRPTLDRALVAAFLAPDCWWFEHEAEPLMSTVPESMLTELREQVSGRRLAIVDRVLAKR